MLWMLPFKRYFEFSGRSGRAEYWQFIAAVVAMYIVAAIIGYAGSSTPVLLVMLGCTVPIYAVTFRRLHDRNLSGWFIGAMWVLNGIYFVISNIRTSLQGSVIDVPFMVINGLDLTATMVLALYLLVQLCMRGDETDNRFGPPPAPHVSDLGARVGVASFLDGARASRTNHAHLDRLDQLERLAKLHREGVLSEAEFDQQKNAILGDSRP